MEKAYKKLFNIIMYLVIVITISWTLVMVSTAILNSPPKVVNISGNKVTVVER